MKHKPTEPTKTIYYTDERNDEFADDNITPKVIDENYCYINSRLRWRLGRFIAYRLIAIPFGWLYCKLALHARFRNRKILRPFKGQGCFVYGNHTQQIGDPFIPNMMVFPRSAYVIVHPNNVSMPVLGRVTPYLGALPLPSNMKAMKNFREAIRTRVAQGNVIIIYPEAHIWPFYTGIRDFPNTSMKYAVELGVPSFAMTTTYHRRRFGKKPRTVTYLDGPFYPDTSLSPRAQAQDLRDRIHATMTARASESDCEYIRYVKKEEN
jgi:1-acyl-sn-glycerol-3-phosphate acyltransferase